MNAELVESLVQVIQTLPPAEQSMLKQRLAYADQPIPPLPHFTLLRPLIATGQIIPPPQPNPSRSDREFRAIVQQIQVSGLPLSQTAIEDRGEW
jgi:hypothetical protein